MLAAPVVVVIFNRPHLLMRVFEQIRQAQPRRLFVVADGPRSDRPDDADKCERSLAIARSVDWKCDVSFNISPTNLGCGRRLPTGLDWVFEQVDSAIILEDDCYPDLTFFSFCDQLLEYYRNDQRLMSVSGTNFAQQWKTPYSYLFSKHQAIWGWATWARAWKHFDSSMSAWKDPSVKQQIRKYLRDDTQYTQRAELFDQIINGLDNVWCYQWIFAQLVQGGLSVVPHVNLVTNIGFGEDATHTIQTEPSLIVQSGHIELALRHPARVVADSAYDKFMIQTSWGLPPAPTFLQRMRRLAGRVKRSVLRRL